MMNFYIFLLFLGVLSLCMIRKHMFLCLIILELIVINLLVIVYLYCFLFNDCMYLYIIIMTFYVCDGALGLSLMVLLIRCHSNDYLNSMMLW